MICYALCTDSTQQTLIEWALLIYRGDHVNFCSAPYSRTRPRRDSAENKCKMEKSAKAEYRDKSHANLESGANLDELRVRVGHGQTTPEEITSAPFAPQHR